MTATAVPFHYNSFRFIPYNLVCVEPLVTHQSSWLETTGVCGVQKPTWLEFSSKQSLCPAVGNLGQITKSADL